MTFRISQRGKEYLETAQTLLRAAQTMTDQHVADQLKALAEDYERRAEKASHADRAKALARSAARVDRDDQAYEPEVPIKVREWIAGESGEGNHAAMRLARYSSSQPAVFLRRRIESFPGAFRVRL